MMRALIPALLVTASLTLGGCGFTPMYGQSGLASRLSGIEVVAPEGRAGYLLREALDDVLAREAGGGAVYRLDLTLAQTRIERGVRNNAADRYELTFTADYKLVEISGGRLVHEGKAQAEVTFDAAEQPYAGLAAQSDAEERAARETARRIQLDLAAALAEAQ